MKVRDFSRKLIHTLTTSIKFHANINLSFKILSIEKFELGLDSFLRSEKSYTALSDQ